MKNFYVSIFLAMAGLCRSQNIVFADTDFKAHLLSSGPGNPVAANAGSQGIVVDANADGEISLAEAAAVYKLSILNKPAISDVSGIEHLVNLHTLTIMQTPLTQLDVSALSTIQQILITDCPITSLNVSGLQNLIDLQCQSLALSSLDVSQVPNLWRLLCYSSGLDNVQVAGLAHLGVLGLAVNQLTSLDLSGLPQLTNLLISYNQISTLDVSGLTSLQSFLTEGNLLTTLNVNDLSNLWELKAGHNHLEQLYIKNTAHTATNGTLQFDGNPNLELICTNDDKVPFITAIADGYGYDDVVVNSTCTLGLDSSQAAGFSIYPNPTDGRLHVVVNPGLQPKTAIVYDLLGQKVKSFSNFPETIELSDLAAGYYFLSLETSEGTTKKPFLKR